eukprot:GHVU01038589.1.p1 GENE.GHVU01038589.1~~GHVU01038589.1.p1  ORF type:complete len:253 (+),score=21.16 GHVU01038589.1:696-1454(+)
MRIHEFEAQAVSLMRWGCDSVCQPGFPRTNPRKRLRMLGRRRAPRSDNADADSSSNADCKEQKGGAAVLQSRLAGHRLLGECGPRVAWEFQCEADSGSRIGFAAAFISDTSLRLRALLFVFVDVRQSTRPGRAAARPAPPYSSYSTWPAELGSGRRRGSLCGGMRCGADTPLLDGAYEAPAAEVHRRTPFLPRAMGPAVDAHPFLTIDIRFVIAVEGTSQAVVGGGCTAAPPIRRPLSRRRRLPPCSWRRAR